MQDVTPAHHNHNVACFRLVVDVTERPVIAGGGDAVAGPGR